jgi:DNA-binding response OmpR family regulator
MSKPRGRPSALLVDDNPQVLQSLALLLEVMGWDTAKINRSEQALALLQERDFELAIVDLKMPHVNGIELCRQIHSQTKKKAPMVFILSGYVDQKSHADALDSGARAILHKPIGLDEMKDLFKTNGLPCAI